jgi:hypothetical protein
MSEQQRRQRRTPKARLAPAARAAEGAAGRAAREWWWAGRLAALHGFPAESCTHRTPGEPRRRWLAGFAAGARVVTAPGAAAA